MRSPTELIAGITLDACMCQQPLENKSQMSVVAAPRTACLDVPSFRELVLRHGELCLTDAEAARLHNVPVFDIAVHTTGVVFVVQIIVVN